MSAQKLAEAEKLLEKGKVAEAIQAFKSLVASEPNNQTYVTKLSAAYAADGDMAASIATLLGYAKRVGKAGKPQLAVAILKQALEREPENVGLLEEYAAQCEASGKFSEAANTAQKVLAIYLPRKKYFDALNVFPLLVRVAPKEQKFRAAWVEIMGIALAEQKLIHLLVALLGPPGLTSEVFETGGDPTELSPEVFDSIKGLTPWFPRDAKAAYAVAWGCYRRGDLPGCYSNLREAIRRDPDFTLASLLFARILAEQQKLNESLFVYRYVKERVISDRQVPSPILNKQIAAFEEKNGWISFSEGGSSDEHSAETFLNAILGKQAEADGAEKPVETPAKSDAVVEAAPKEVAASASTNDSEGVALPGEVELGGSEEGAGELILSSGEAKKIQARQEEKAEPTPAPQVEKPKSLPVEEEASAPTPAESEAAAPEPVAPRPPADEPALSPLDLIASLKKEPAWERKAPAAPVPASPAQEAIESVPKEVPTSEVGPLDDGVEREEATQIIDPAKLKEMLAQVGASKSEDFSAPSDDANETKSGAAEPETNEAGLTFGSAALQEFMSGALGVAAPESETEAEEADTSTDVLQEAKVDEAPMETPSEEPQEEATANVTVAPSGDESSLLESIREMEFTSPLGAVMAGQERGFNFEATKATESPKGEGPDLGDDLLAQPTGMIEADGLTVATSMSSEGAGGGDETRLAEPTQAVPTTVTSVEGAELPEMPSEPTAPPKEEIPPLTPEEVLFRGDQQLAAGKFHFARKFYRQALAIGADPAVVREKLREARARELPEGLYTRASSDLPSGESIGDIVDRLVADFHLDIESEASGKLHVDLATLIKTNDPTALLELGIGFLEMGMHGEAESVWAHVRANGTRDDRIKAGGLMAESKKRRGDFPGAVALLRRLAGDATLSDLEKVPLLFSLGESLERMQRKEESRECFLEVARIDPDFRNVRSKVQ